MYERYTQIFYGVCNDSRFRCSATFTEITDGGKSFNYTVSINLENTSDDSIDLNTTLHIRYNTSTQQTKVLSETINANSSINLVLLEYSGLEYNSIDVYTLPISIEIIQDKGSVTPDLYCDIEDTVVFSKGQGAPIYLTEFTEEDKHALKVGSAVVMTRIIVKPTITLPELILTEQDSVKTWTISEERYVPDNGVIGQYVARSLSGELQDISDDFNIENRIIQVCVGIKHLGAEGEYLLTENNQVLSTEDGKLLAIADVKKTTVNWYTLGSFVVTDPNDDEVTDNTKFDAMDYTVLLNNDFNADYVSIAFPTSFATLLAREEYPTALWLAQYACEQCGLTFKNTSFTNSDFLITTNQFTTGDSCRDVLKAISQLAYGWCRTGWDDGVYIDEFETTSTTNEDTSLNTITNDDYFSLTTKKNTFGPINRVVIGMKDVEGENVYVEDTNSINENGLHELGIYDNPITYTQELRDSVKEQAKQLFGLSYTPFESETKGDPWLKANQTLFVVDMENNIKQTYPFNKTIKYTGHITTDLEGPANTLTYESTVYNSSLYKTIRDVRIQVNKQDGVINIINSNLRATNNGLEALEKRVATEITDSYTKTEIQEIISGTAADGTKVSSVTTTAGTFNKDGLTIEQTNATTKTNLNANGMIIYDTTGSGDDELLVVNSDGVVGKNMTVRTYLTIGSHSRLEDYTHTDGTNGTGVFWIGD